MLITRARKGLSMACIHQHPENRECYLRLVFLRQFVFFVSLFYGNIKRCHKYTFNWLMWSRWKRKRHFKPSLRWVDARMLARCRRNLEDKKKKTISSCFFPPLLLFFNQWNQSIHEQWAMYIHSWKINRIRHCIVMSLLLPFSAVEN